AAGHYALTVIAEGLEDHPDNATRFVLIRRRSGTPDS
ncbi:MAG: prephenate dehydratase domain-containing protein, partial [Gemmatimonadaceae bacterium]